MLHTPLRRKSATGSCIDSRSRSRPSSFHVTGCQSAFSKPQLCSRVAVGGHLAAPCGRPWRLAGARVLTIFVSTAPAVGGGSSEPPANQGAVRRAAHVLLSSITTSVPRRRPAAGLSGGGAPCAMGWVLRASELRGSGIATAGHQIGLLLAGHR
jgi:hypothetical protein